MRRPTALAAVAVATLVCLSLLASTRATTLARTSQSGQERFVVFETFGRTG